MRKHRLIEPFRIIIVSIIIFLLVSFLWHRLKNLEYFKVKEIITKESPNFDLLYLKDSNILTLDLGKEAKYIAEIHPSYRKVRLIRILPNRLFVDFIRRKPLGVVKLYRYFCVDEDLVLFDLPEGLQMQDLPLITGLETKIFGPKAGKVYKIKELVFAVNIINEVNRSRLSRVCGLKKIEVGNLSNASFFLLIPQSDSSAKKSQGPVELQLLEIRIEQDNLKDKINILSSLFMQSRKDWNKIKYIDLRFKEPVIKLNDVKY